MSDEFGSFQGTWSQLAQEDPETQTALEEWALSTDGQFQYLENNTTNASPAGTSAPTTDPAGTYSGPGASAPTLAAAGTYIPCAGATSSAAEVADPAGTDTPAGASAPITDPAGTYSRHRGERADACGGGHVYSCHGGHLLRGGGSRSCRHLYSGGRERADHRPGRHVQRRPRDRAHAGGGGHVFPVTGPTSSAAEKVDPAGTYSLAGASAPTPAQPGYYVATAGASSETPDSSGYYQPNSGATSGIPAQPLAISGTVAGQTTAPLETDTPFSSVTISDPNTDTTDHLRLRYGRRRPIVRRREFRRAHDQRAWRLPPVRDRDCDRQRAPRADFHSERELDATTFTLTDTSTAGKSASDANTTVTVESTTPVVVSVATFLADQSTLDEDADGFDILDTAAHHRDLNPLDDPNINSIIILDSAQVGPSVQQLTSDATAIGELQNANSSPVLLAVTDSAADIEAGLSTLVAERATSPRSPRRPAGRWSSGRDIPRRPVDARQDRRRVRHLR